MSEIGRRLESSAPRTRGSSDLSLLHGDLEEIAAQILLQNRKDLPFDEVSSPLSRSRSLDLKSTARVCAMLAYNYMKAKLSGDANQIATLEENFVASACDPAWASTVNEYLKFFGPSGGRKSIPYVSPTSTGSRIIRIRKHARVALIADWGTGAPPALRLLREVKKLSPDIIIHLGDVYYSGTPTEYARAFCNPISEIVGSNRTSVPVYALSGNHDMYCGGIGFYQTISNLNPGDLQQRSSFFCLRSEDDTWQFVAMDTGLHDYSPLSIDESLTHLDPDEEEWVNRRVAEFNGRSIFLSHHQPFSAFSQIGKQGCLNPNLTRVLDRTRQVCAWFWGHEHILAIYEPFAGLNRGRCIGHGAVPVDAAQNIYTPLPGQNDLPRILSQTRLGLDGGVYARGFALLTLGDHSAPTKADYYQHRFGQTELLYSEQVA